MLYNKNNDNVVTCFLGDFMVKLKYRTILSVFGIH